MSQEQPLQKPDHYRTGVVVMLRVVMLETLVIFTLSIALAIFLGSRQDNDRYFAETNEGRAMQMTSLPLPNIGRRALATWVASAASQVMTFGFNDVDESFAASRKNFTEDGWKDFRKGLVENKLIDKMTATQQILTSVPQSSPVIKQEGMINGEYSWVYDVPLLLTFRAGGDKRSVAKTVHITVVRMPTEENPNGVGINEWYVR